jgi:hypothetical protein
MNEGTDGMWTAARLGTGQFIRTPGYKRVRAITIMELVMPIDNVCDIRVPGHQLKWIEVFAFHATEW